MARSFDGASQYLWYSGAVLSAVPISMAAWFSTSNNTAQQGIMSIARNPNTVGARVAWLLVTDGAVAGDPIGAYSCDSAGGWSNAATTTGFSLNTIHHACAVFAANNDRRVYIDGGSKGTNATNRVPGATPNTTAIAAVLRDTVGGYFAGFAAECAIWNVALTDADVAVLATRASPLLVRPEYLIAYWPVIGRYSPEIDVVGIYGLTLVAAPPAAAHVPIRYAYGPRKVVTPTRYTFVPITQAEMHRRTRCPGLIDSSAL